jgi:hypothetical protein
VSVFSQFWMLNRTGLPLFYKQVPHDPKEHVGEIKVIRKYAQLESLDPKDWYGEGGELFGEVPSHPSSSAFQILLATRHSLSFHHAERALQAAGSAHDVCLLQARYRWQQGFDQDRRLQVVQGV